MQRYFFFLFSDVLVYTDPLNPVTGKYKFHRTLKIVDVVRALATDRRKWGPCTMRFMGDTKDFLLVADDEASFESWFRTISECKDGKH